ncbi:MAG: hypothetical protein D6776_04075 [Planctomycetota bacterium]|nr:MAG: hypothetical protein D6776_04075 [Planctomycetota bacterium]
MGRIGGRLWVGLVCAAMLLVATPRAGAQTAEVARALRRAEAQLAVNDFAGARRFVALAERRAPAIHSPERRAAMLERVERMRARIDEVESAYWRAEAVRFLDRARKARARGNGPRIDRLVGLLIARAEAAARRSPLPAVRKELEAQVARARKELLPVPAPAPPPAPEPPPAATPPATPPAAAPAPPATPPAAPATTPPAAPPPPAGAEPQPEPAPAPTPPTPKGAADSAGPPAPEHAGPSAGPARPAAEPATPSGPGLGPEIAAIEPIGPGADALKAHWLAYLARSGARPVVWRHDSAPPPAGSPVLVGPLVPAAGFRSLDGPVLRFGQQLVVLRNAEGIFHPDAIEAQLGEPIGLAGWVRGRTGVVRIDEAGRPVPGSAREAVALEIAGLWSDDAFLETEALVPPDAPAPDGR